MNRNKNSGFTIIELMMVIAIIGILATIAQVRIGNLLAIVRDTARISLLKQVQQAVEVYYADHNKYPDTGTPPTWLSDCLYPTTYVPNLVPDYLKSLPRDPQSCKMMLNGEHRCICYKSNGTDYVIATHNETLEHRFQAYFPAEADGGPDPCLADGDIASHFVVNSRPCNTGL